MEISFKEYNDLLTSLVFQIVVEKDKYIELVENNIETAEQIYIFLSPIRNHYLKIVTGEADSRFGNPSIKEGICINRLLQKLNEQE